MRSKSLILLMLALGCGLVASIGVTQVMARRNQPVAAAGETAPILVALQSINGNDPIDVKLLKLEEWPKDRIPPGAISEIEAVEGRRARTKIYQGDPILEAKLSGSGDGEIEIPKGLRVVAVQVDAVSGGAGLMMPGDRVDVLLTVTRNPGAGINDSGAKTILQDVKVFAVNELSRRGDDPEEKLIPRTVSLLVTPQQSEKVILASELGRIRLIMRNPGDKAEDIGPGAKVSDVIDTMGEKIDRQIEVAGEPPVGQGGLLDFLKGSQREPAEKSAPVHVARHESFVMEILEGAARRTVEFRRQGEDSVRWQNLNDGAVAPGPAVEDEVALELDEGPVDNGTDEAPAADEDAEDPAAAEPVLEEPTTERKKVRGATKELSRLKIKAAGPEGT